MTRPPVSLDTTPAGLLKIADRLDALAGNCTGYEASIGEAAEILRALATSSPPAPQEDHLFAPDSTGQFCATCGSTRFASHVAPAVPDHAGLIARLVMAAELADEHALMPSGDLLREAAVALRPTGGETHE